MKDAKPPFRSRKQEPGTARARPPRPNARGGTWGMAGSAKSSPAPFSQAIAAFWELVIEFYSFSWLGVVWLFFFLDSSNR